MYDYQMLPDADWATPAQAILWVAFGVRPKSIRALVDAGLPSTVSAMSPRVLSELYGQGAPLTFDNFQQRLATAKIELFEQLGERRIRWRGSRVTQNVKIFAVEQPHDTVQVNVGRNPATTLKYEACVAAHKLGEHVVDGPATSEEVFSPWGLALFPDIDWDAVCVPAENYLDAKHGRLVSISFFSFSVADLMALQPLQNEDLFDHPLELIEAHKRFRKEFFESRRRRNVCTVGDLKFKREFTDLLGERAFIIDYLSPTMDVLLRVAALSGEQVYEANKAAIEKTIEDSLLAADKDPEHPFTLNELTLSKSAVTELVAALRPFVAKSENFHRRHVDFREAGLLKSRRYLVLEMPGE